MLKFRSDGNPALQPLLGSHTPWRPPTKLVWHPIIGDLKDLRSRRGFQVPQSEFQAIKKIPYTPIPMRMNAIVDYLQTLCNKCAARPTFMDPNERTAGGSTPRVERFSPPPSPAPRAPEQEQAEEQGKKDSVSEPFITSQEWEAIFPFLRDTPLKKRLFTKIGKSTGSGTTPVITNVEWAELFPRWQSGDFSTVPPRVYLNKERVLISKWSMNLRMTETLNRKTNLINLKLKRLEAHNRHGAVVRITKLDRVAESRAKFLEVVQKSEARSDAARRPCYSSTKKKTPPAVSPKPVQPQQPHRVVEPDACLEEAIAATARYNLEATRQRQLQEGGVPQPSEQRVRWRDVEGRDYSASHRQQLPQASSGENERVAAHRNDVEKQESFDFMR